MSFTPSKALAWTLQGYYGRDINNYGVQGNIGLIDRVLTWNATSALSLVGSVDWDRAKHLTVAIGQLAGRCRHTSNYAINDSWRASLRGEYFDDRDGYLTRNFDPTTFAGADQKLKEITLTLGYDPTKNFEFRLEGRYEIGHHRRRTSRPRTYQGWFEAIYKF